MKTNHELIKIDQAWLRKKEFIKQNNERKQIFKFAFALLVAAGITIYLSLYLSSILLAKAAL